MSWLVRATTWGFMAGYWTGRVVALYKPRIDQVKYIEHMGGLWRLSEGSYNKLYRYLQKKFKAGESFSIHLDDYGKLIGTVEELGSIQDEAQADVMQDEQVTVSFPQLEKKH